MNFFGGWPSGFFPSGWARAELAICAVVTRRNWKRCQGWNRCRHHHGWPGVRSRERTIHAFRYAPVRRRQDRQSNRASGEYKDVDRFRGKPTEDTGITSVFLGPRLIASLGRFSAEIAAEFPVSIDNTALQVVPDYRLRGAVSFHF